MASTIRFVIAAVLLGAGALTALISIFGVYKFNYVMNRMHCAAIIDSMVLFLVLAGLMVLSGSIAYIPKLILVLCFQWISSPIASHMVGRLEVQTDDAIKEFMEFEEDREEVHE